jgi:NAD-dependent deacetylase
MPSSSRDLTHARKLIQKAQRICVMTGAGISAESGIQTFRDAGGLWEGHSVEKVATPEGFTQDPDAVWRFYNARRKSADIATPNAAHLALARLEIEITRSQKKSSPDHGHGNGNGNGAAHKAASPFTLLTQNIDGLHQQAGSSHVIEMHGSIWKVRCTGCGAITTDHPIELPILPKCPACGKLLRPHVVWFGEMLDKDILDAAESATRTCDLFMVIGTSALVQPAASYPFMASQRDVPVIEVNKEHTPISAIVAFSLIGKAGEILPKLISD